jgi:hypothetical protein
LKLGRKGLGAARGLSITVGGTLGTFPIADTRLKANFFGGTQFALTPHPAIASPLTPVYSRS